MLVRNVFEGDNFFVSSKMSVVEDEGSFTEINVHLEMQFNLDVGEKHAKNP